MVVAMASISFIRGFIRVSKIALVPAEEAQRSSLGVPEAPKQCVVGTGKVVRRPL